MMKTVTIEEDRKKIVNGMTHPAIRPDQKHSPASTPRPATPLVWQSRVLTIAVLSICGAAAALYSARSWTAVTQCALLLSLTFALAAWRARAATIPAAFAGGVLAAAMFLASTESMNWLRSALLPLLAVLVLTHLATRFGRRRKERLGAAEDRHGRNAGQVVANLGIAGLAGGFVLLHTLHTPNSPKPIPPFLRTIHMAMLAAALAEATADTLSSEIGQVLGGRPALITTTERVTPGTDGGITLPGTLAGVGGAAAIALISMPCLGLGFHSALDCALAAIAGMFFDSLLGATAERKGLLNNDAVNFLSTLMAAVLTAVLLGLGRSPR